MTKTQVDFYISPKSTSQEQLLLACRLLEKAYGKKHQIFVYLNHQATMATLDEMLWTYRDDSFLPHSAEGEFNELTPIVLSTNPPKDDTTPELLLNLTPTVPEFYSNFKRVLEIIYQDDTAKAQGRERFQHYRQNQCDLHSHQL